MTKKTSKVFCHFLFSGYTAVVWKQAFIRELTGGCVDVCKGEGKRVASCTLRRVSIVKMAPNSVY